MSVDNDGDDESAACLEEEKIILSFVSHGHHEIGGGESEMDVGESEEVESIGEEISEEEGGRNGSIEDGDEEEEEGELVLVILPFATSEYLDDKADTIVLSLEDGNEA